MKERKRTFRENPTAYFLIQFVARTRYEFLVRTTGSCLTPTAESQKTKTLLFLIRNKFLFSGEILQDQEYRPIILIMNRCPETAQSGLGICVMRYVLQLQAMRRRQPFQQVMRPLARVQYSPRRFQRRLNLLLLSLLRERVRNRFP